MLNLFQSVFISLFGTIILFILIRAISLPLKVARNSPKRYLKKKSIPSSDEKKKKIIVSIGDSITHGLVSWDYVAELAKRFPSDEYVFINAGINSEFAYNVWVRIDEIIACKPDIITILIGTNDAIHSFLPETQESAKRRLKLPALPTIEEYQKYLPMFVEKLKEKTDAKIAILSIPTIGEDMSDSNPINPYLDRFCEFIQQFANSNVLTYLPLNERMRDYSNENPSSTNYPIKTYHSIVLKSIIKRLLFCRPFESIAKGLGYRLHSDHLHLNESGATMVADLIEEYIKNTND